MLKLKALVIFLMVDLRFAPGGSLNSVSLSPKYLICPLPS
jgi:hypothetical protein